MPSLVALWQAHDPPFPDPTLLLRGDASGRAAQQRARVPHRAARGRALRLGRDRWGHHGRRHCLRGSSPRPARGLARGGRLRLGHLEPLLEVRPRGLRYLALGDVATVRSTALERKVLHRIAPHLAEQLGAGTGPLVGRACEAACGAHHLREARGRWRTRTATATGRARSSRAASRSSIAPSTPTPAFSAST
jgi:hypothetical protein